MSHRFHYLLVAAAVLFPLAANAAANDPHKLAAAETRIFRPLLCTKPVPRGSGANCAGLTGNPTFAGTAQVLNLTTVAYGGFTHARADQAYVSYTSSFESHATNFGGGILFERHAGAWRVVRWYSGGAMERCVALPPGGVQRMLCLTGYEGMGEIDSSVWLNRVPEKPPADSALDSVAVLKAQDNRGSTPLNEPCTIKRAPGEALLLSVDNLTRSNAPGILAQARVVYAVPADVKAACARKDFAHVKETKGVVRFRMQGGRVVADTPAKFAATDY